jgi:hypothetical protein
MLPGKKRKTADISHSHFTNQSSAAALDVISSGAEPTAGVDMQAPRGSHIVLLPDTKTEPASHPHGSNAGAAGNNTIAAPRASEISQHTSSETTMVDNPIQKDTILVDICVHDTPSDIVDEDYDLPGDDDDNPTVVVDLTMQQQLPDSTNTPHYNEEMSPESWPQVQDDVSVTAPDIDQVDIQVGYHTSTEALSIPSTPVLLFHDDSETNISFDAAEEDPQSEEPAETAVEEQDIQEAQQQGDADVADIDFELAMRDSIRTHGEEEAHRQAVEENKRTNEHLDEWLNAVRDVHDPESSQPNHIA